MLHRRINELLDTEYRSDSDINWRYLSTYKNLSEDFIREFRDYVNWESISIHQTLSESFINEFENYIVWSYISSNQILSESFIRKFRDKVDWEWISNYQILSESFIREFKDEVNWDFISKYQLLSWDFILKFKDRVNWGNISLHQPFIDDSNYGEIFKKLLKYNKIYHLHRQTKDRGWFLGYIHEDYVYKKIDWEYFSIDPDLFTNYLKSRIYWKDLVMTNKIKNFESIRQVRHV